MKIDREYLEATIRNLTQQEQEAEALANKSRGAILLAEALLARLEEKEPETAPPTPTLVTEPTA